MKSRGAQPSGRTKEEIQQEIDKEKQFRGFGKK